MLKRRLLKGLSSIFRFSRKHGERGIYSVEEFKAIIDRERTRCERNSHEFSLVVFTPGGDVSDGTYTKRISKVVSRRARCTDETGWLNSTQIGVVLPDTPTLGANKFAEDVSQRIESLSLDPMTYSVFTYPSGHLPDGGEPGSGKYRQLTFADALAAKKNSKGNKRGGDSGSKDSGGGSSGNGGGRELSWDTAAGQDKLTTPGAIEEVSMISCFSPPLWKRAMDCAGALFLMLIWSPIFAFLALWIKIVSPGPIFFTQDRVGISGRKFTCWKFRTMKQNAETSSHNEYVKSLIKGNSESQADADAPMIKLDDHDPRIIPFGKIIRKTGFDELPQLFNVLKGDMSLVGPRPCLPYEYEEYSLWHARRCDAIPGLTGLWQVSGKNTTTFKEMMRLDINYSRRRSFWLDVKILLMTVPAIIGQIRR